MVFGAAALFFVSVLPVYLSVFIYADADQKYAQANFYVYGIKFLNVNTAEDGSHMQINGKDTQLDLPAFLKSFKAVINHLCIFRITQLGDYGMERERNAYIALAQCGLTFPAYSYLSCTGSRCRLKNYIVFSNAHGNVRYGAKVVCAVNLVSALKILLVIFMEKFK